jgi:hypothetical protein
MTERSTVDGAAGAEHRGLKAKVAVARREVDERTAGWGSGSDAADDFRLVAKTGIFLWAFGRELWRTWTRRGAGA